MATFALLLFWTSFAAHHLAMTNNLPFDELLIRKSALVLRALKNNLRQKILKLIHQQQTITVTEIYIKLRIEQSVASQHLKILRDAKIVDTQRDGKKIYYTINYSRMATIQKAADGILATP